MHVKRLTSVKNKKVMYAIFSLLMDLLSEISDSRDRSVTSKYYRDVSRKLKKNYFNKVSPSIRNNYTSVIFTSVRTNDCL